MCNFMFTFCAYLAEGSLVAGIGTGSGLRAKPRPSTWVAFASYFLCAMCVCVYNFLVIQLSEFDKL